MNRKIALFAIFVLSNQFLFAQNIESIQVSEVSRIEKILSADDMQGRRTFSPGIEKAADFIAAEFKKAGIKPWKGNHFFQEFEMQRTRFISARAVLDGNPINESNIVALSSQKNILISNTSGYEKLRVKATDTLNAAMQRMLSSDKNYFVIVDTIHARNFNNVKRFRRESMSLKNNIVMVLSASDASTFSVEFNQEVTALKLKNVVGIIPGKSKKEEFVIFSGHYDHLGIGKTNKEMDSIFNGANDDASGITAVLMLAAYFNKLNNNERTLVFAAFTAEEMGGYGSNYFSKQFDPNKVMAMFNIEMIGTESKWGTNSAFITGYEKTDMGRILEKNLAETQFKFYPDPYPAQDLFYRSDNATLARQGVPAHTISTSKMDSEKFYHTQDDEFETLDMKNMTEIIKAIALSSKTIVSGKDSPQRVDTKQLK